MRITIAAIFIAMASSAHAVELPFGINPAALNYDRIPGGFTSITSQGKLSRGNAGTLFPAPTWVIRTVRIPAYNGIVYELGADRNMPVFVGR